MKVQIGNQQTGLEVKDAISHLRKKYVGHLRWIGLWITRFWLESYYDGA